MRTEPYPYPCEIDDCQLSTPVVTLMVSDPGTGAPVPAILDPETGDLVPAPVVVEEPLQPAISPWLILGGLAALFFLKRTR